MHVRRRAERFWAWKHKKALERKERRQEAKERKARADAAPNRVPSESIAAASVPVAAASSIAHIKLAEAPAEESPVDPTHAGFGSASYPADTSAIGATEYAPEAYAYDNATPYTNYEYGYGYSDYDYSNYYDSGAGPAAEAAYTPLDASGADVAAPLVDSSGYFAAPDGNASTWQSYEYDAAASNNDSYYYGDANGGYGTTEGYPATDYATGASGYYNGDTGVAYDSTDASAWSGYAQSQHPADAYSTAAGEDSGQVLPTNGYYDTSHYAAAASDSSDNGYSGGDGYTVGGDAGAWEEVFDPQSNQTYYVNRVTGESAWQPPTSSY